MSRRKEPDILNRNVVAQSRLFSIESLELRFSNGEERIYERLKPSGKKCRDDGSRN